jgi:hypothetical protein
VNTGGGGGGRIGGAPNGQGGKGVVIIRHDAAYATALHSGTLTEVGGYKIYTFNDSGSFGWGG